MENINNETITQGLGISDSWFDEIVNEITRIWNENRKVSEALEQMAQLIKDKEFQTQIPITEYEKKLVLSGYISGQAASHADQEMQHKMDILSGILGIVESKKEGNGDAD